MYLPNKITNVLSKISKYYIVEYNDGKISSVSISDKDINIEMSSKGYCISIKGSNIHVDDLQGLEPLLIKIGAIKNSNEKIKKEQYIRDNLIELFSKNVNSFSVQYKLGKVVSVNIKSPTLILRKNSVGYLLISNNESISIDSLTSLKSLLYKMNILSKDKKENKNKELGFEQLMMDLDI